MEVKVTSHTKYPKMTALKQENESIRSDLDLLKGTMLKKLKMEYLNQFIEETFVRVDIIREFDEYSAVLATRVSPLTQTSMFWIVENSYLDVRFKTYRQVAEYLMEKGGRFIKSRIEGLINFSNDYKGLSKTIGSVDLDVDFIEDYLKSSIYRTLINRGKLAPTYLVANLFSCEINNLTANCGALNAYNFSQNINTNGPGVDVYDIFLGLVGVLSYYSKNMIIVNDRVDGVADLLMGEISASISEKTHNELDLDISDLYSEFDEEALSFYLDSTPFVSKTSVVKNKNSGNDIFAATLNIPIIREYDDDDY